MKKLVTVFHLKDGELIPVFEWETKKKGSIYDVVTYLMKKFNNPAEFPKGYENRTLKKGDVLEITILEGPTAGKVMRFEVLSQLSYQMIF